MTENKSFLNAMTVLGLLLAIGMASAAFILGVQAKRAVVGQQSITVKGLAEKPIKADRAEWTIKVAVSHPTQAGALQAVAQTRQVVTDFLEKQGFAKDTWSTDVETIGPNYVDVYDPNYRQVQRGYASRQNIRVVSNDLGKVQAAYKAVLQLRADNHPIVAETPKYLVGNLEDIKMSLIADATQNARKRAVEFVKQDGAKVGVMKSARQGTFSILSVGGANDDASNSYGGVYDKSTIEKKARVVVTIVYNIE